MEIVQSVLDNSDVLKGLEKDATVFFIGIDVMKCEEGVSNVVGFRVHSLICLSVNDMKLCLQRNGIIRELSLSNMDKEK